MLPHDIDQWIPMFPSGLLFEFNKSFPMTFAWGFIARSLRGYFGALNLNCCYFISFVGAIQNILSKQNRLWSRTWSMWTIITETAIFHFESTKKIIGSRFYIKESIGLICRNTLAFTFQYMMLLHDIDQWIPMVPSGLSFEFNKSFIMTFLRGFIARSLRGWSGCRRRIHTILNWCTD